MIDAAPLLVPDMYEHAYHQEFGANASAYIDAFMRNVDSTAVGNRLTQATDRVMVAGRTAKDDVGASISVEELAARRATRPQARFGH